MPATSKRRARQSKKTSPRRPRGGTHKREWWYAIPYSEPNPLPDGLHIAPYRSWDGTPMLLVIRDGECAAPPLRLESLKSPLSQYEGFDYSAVALAGYHCTWTRGVYRDPHFHNTRQVRFFAIDSHGRAIHSAVADQKAPGTAIDECRLKLTEEDPIVRPRPRGEGRF